MNRQLIWLLVIVAVLAAMLIAPELALAQSYGGGDFESKVGGLTRHIINFLLPAASILGLVYAAILAATGDSGARGRMVLVIFASIVGFIAPFLIHWLQSITGGGG